MGRGHPLVAYLSIVAMRMLLSPLTTRTAPACVVARAAFTSHRNGLFAAAAAAQLEPLWPRLVRRSPKVIPIAHPATMRSGQVRRARLDYFFTLAYCYTLASNISAVPGVHEALANRYLSYAGAQTPELPYKRGSLETSRFAAQRPRTHHRPGRARCE